jgi:hypothetical protein
MPGCPNGVQDSIGSLGNENDRTDAEIVDSQGRYESQVFVEAKTYEHSSRKTDPKSSDDIQAQTCIAEPSPEPRLTDTWRQCWQIKLTRNSPRKRLSMPEVAAAIIGQLVKSC